MRLDDAFAIVMFAVLAVLVLLVGVLIVDYVGGERRDTQVTIINSFYEPSRTGTGIGYAATSSGGAPTVVVTSSGPEYDLLVEFPNGGRDIVSTNKKTLLALNNGEKVTLSCLYGAITGGILSCRKEQP